MTIMSAYLTRFSIAFLVASCLLPLLPVGAWVVRLFDFPRIQLAALVVIPVLGLLLWYRRSGWNIELSLIAMLCMAVVAWQLSHVVKYTWFWPKELVDAKDTANSITVTVINLDYQNSEKDAVREQIRSRNDDVVLLIEIDEDWADAFTEIEALYPYREGVSRGEGLGITLWSKIAFKNARVRHLVSEHRASIHAKLEPANGPPINFVGVHPVPPGLNEPDIEGRHDSRIRDAELMLVAKDVARATEEYWIVTGDFNDVAWSHTSRVFKRISGLKDPRVGRGLFNTYHAKYPGVRFPIDQVYLSPGAKIVKIDRFRPHGSDHFAIATRFSIGDLSEAKPRPKQDDHQEAKEMIRDGQQDAQEIDAAD